MYSYILDIFFGFSSQARVIDDVYCIELFKKKHFFNFFLSSKTQRHIRHRTKEAKILIRHNGARTKNFSEVEFKILISLKFHFCNLK